MNALFSRISRTIPGIMIGATLLLAGCATAKTDWAGRVGRYTYEQTVLELGPPDKSANLADGTIVAEWLTVRGYAHGFYFPPGYGFGAYYYSEPPSPDHYLRLTFAPGGTLSAWKRLYK